MQARNDCGTMMAVQGPRMLHEAYRQEIERAIDNVKRTGLDNWFRRQWYRTRAIGRKQLPSHRPRVSGARRW